MSEGTLSQEEIDALLTGGGAPPEQPKSSQGSTVSVLQNILEGTVGDMTSSLRPSIGDDFQLQLTSVSEFSGDLPVTGNVIKIQADINNGNPYDHFYILSGTDALKILSATTGMSDLQIDDSMLEALQELFEHVVKVLSAALSFQLGAVNVRIQGVTQGESVSTVLGDKKSVMVKYQFETNPMDSGALYEFFDTDLVDLISNPEQGPMMQGGAGSGIGSSRAGAGMGMGTQSASTGTAIQSIQFPQLTSTTQPSDQGNLGLLMDVSMEMTVELGRTRKLIQEILEMGEGTIIELDKLAGEPVDILVNHKLIAKGEVVVIDENFGVRVTEILSPFDRVKDY